MEESSDDIVIWKTSLRGAGDRHLRDGYPTEDFPGVPGSRPDGCAYFARDRWIADEFAKPILTGYENFIIEIRIPKAIYEQSFRQFEQAVDFERGRGIQLAIPAAELELLNETGKRTIASDLTAQDS